MTTGGSFKASDSLVVDRSPDGVQAVRFKPVPAARTEYCAADLIDRYADAVKTNQHHPVLLVGLSSWICSSSTRSKTATVAWHAP
ncbi:hypothetical protein JNB_06304 [Janibacter sp. HTCC2649]|nr:hypothetical protein JNB_06304 [Janibacter sp. HTCC2649]